MAESKKIKTMIAQRTRPRIYLAGPDVFRRNAEAHGLKLKALCLEAGFTPLWPLDAELPKPEGPLSAAAWIFAANVAKIREADVMLANIEPFRGPGMDPGAAWEIGMAFVLKKPVFAYTTDVSAYKYRIDVDSIERTAEHVRMFCGDGMEIEDFGLAENLMIACSVECITASPQEALQLASKWREARNA